MQGFGRENKEDEEEQPQTQCNEYQLLNAGRIKSIKNRSSSYDQIFASDKNNLVNQAINLKVKIANGKSIFADLASGSIPDNSTRYDNVNEKAFPLGINRARTNDEFAVAQIFVFVSNNSNVEWGLGGYNIDGSMIFAIWTGHSQDITPSSILYQGLSKLSFNIHSHPGSTTIPSPVNGMTEGDYGSAAWIDYEFQKNKQTFPRHFVYSKQGKHLWEYTYYDETSSKFYPGKPGVSKPMPVGNTINLKTLRK